jgi:DDE_Tnp_1-associated
MHPLASLAQVFSQVKDPRNPRGVRHPVRGILTLVFLGLLGRIREMEVLVRWAKANWDELREPLGFLRDEPPHATTISRTLARCDLAQFSLAFLTWVKQLTPDLPLTVAVDAKTSRQGKDEFGHPVQLLTVMLHELKIVVAQWSVRGEKTNEPNVLLNHLEELHQRIPALRCFTGDAIFAQRPLAEAIEDENCDYVLQIKANQSEVLEAARCSLGEAHERKPQAESVEKRGDSPIAVVCG